MAMTGIVQKALWNGKVYGFWEPVNKNVVAFGPFINRNHFAGWMLLALPLAVGYFASLVDRGMVGVKPGWRNRVIWFSTPDASRAVLTGFAILVMGFALTLTLSRSGLSGFLLAMVLSTAKGRLLGAYLALVVVAAVAWVGIDAIGARFAEVDWKLGGRAGAWGDAWRIHQAFPWFGTGLNTYGSATLLLQEFEKATAHYVEAHNDYLQLLVEGGWLVTVPALAPLGLFAREVRRRFREGRDDRTGDWLRLGAVTGLWPSRSRKSWSSTCRCQGTRRSLRCCARSPSGGRRRRGRGSCPRPAAAAARRHGWQDRRRPWRTMTPRWRNLTHHGLRDLPYSPLHGLPGSEQEDYSRIRGSHRRRHEVLHGRRLALHRPVCAKGDLPGQTENPAVHAGADDGRVPGPGRTRRGPLHPPYPQNLPLLGHRRHGHSR